MAAVKDFLYAAAEQAFKTESAPVGTKRDQAIRNWYDFITTTEEQYGVFAVQMALDIYDEIADRSGENWELFSNGLTWEELEGIYNRSEK